MKLFKHSLLPLSLFTTIILTAGCSSQQQVVSISEIHPYNDQYGLNKNLYVDSIIEGEIETEDEPTQEDKVVLLDPSYTTDISMDPDAFLAEDYVQKPEVITYKYMFDKKFYSKAEWKTMDSE